MRNQFATKMIVEGYFHEFGHRILLRIQKGKIIERHKPLLSGSLSNISEPWRRNWTKKTSVLEQPIDVAYSKIWISNKTAFIQSLGAVAYQEKVLVNYSHASFLDCILFIYIRIKVTDFSFWLLFIVTALCYYFHIIDKINTIILFIYFKSL